MLRAVRLNNIGDICEDHILSFRQDGVYFFVGQNGSGESKMFEAIQICIFPYLISEKSFPQVVDKCKPAYIICKFETPDSLQNYDLKWKEIFTSFVYIPDAESKKHQYAHIVSIDNKDNLYISLFDNIKVCDVPWPIEIEHKLKMEICKHLKLCVNDKPESTDLLLKALKELPEVRKHDGFCFTPFLWDEIYFPTPITEYGWKESYKILEDKCKYITNILSPDIYVEKRYDSYEEEKIFRIMTGNAAYSFEVKRGEDKLSLSIEGKPVGVSKLPEDILVAKYVSLLLTSKTSTVFLEEPDRGMSSDMIQRFRDIVLPQIKQKTIVIVSHKSVLMTSLSIPRTYKVYKEKQGVARKCKIVSFSGVAEICKNLRLLDTDDFDILIFEKNVIFVESQSDFIFVNALKAHILTSSNDESVKRVLKLFLSDPGDIDDKLNKFRTFLQSLKVKKMSSEKNEQYWHTVSNKLGISRWFLLTRNAVVETDIVETCMLAAERVKSYIEKIVTTALMQGRSQETQQMKSDLQQPLDQAFENEEEKHMKSYDQHMQDNSDLKRVVAEAITVKFWSEKGNASEEITDKDKDDIPLNKAEIEKRLEQVVKNVASLKECNNVEALLKRDDVLNVDAKNTYFQYYDLIYKKLATRSVNPGDPIPVSTKYTAKEVQFIDSPTLKLEFEKLVEKSNLNKIADYLEKKGVFFWRSGNIEDAFFDLVINFECVDESIKYAEMLRRYKSFAELGLILNLTKLPTQDQSKLYLDDKVSDDNISKSIVHALKLCSERSDITQFIRFLMHAKSN